jgi:serine/threonine-protein phosphatase 2A regulatory subunit A
LSDQETEVRNVAIKTSKSCLKNFSTEKITNFLLPTLQSIYADSSAIFKSGMADALCSMASIVGKDVTNMKILPILFDLFKDDHPDVRLSVTDGIFSLAEVLGPDMLTHNLTTQLQALTNDEQWRVRMAGYDLIANLGKTFGVQAFTSQLQTIFFGFFLETAS